MIAVGITDGINLIEIKAICSSPHKPDDDYYLASDFNSLNTLANDITEMTCGHSNGIRCSDNYLDIVIALGMAVDSDDKWNTIKKWATLIVEQQTISNSKTRISLVTLSDRLDIQFKLNKYIDMNSILTAIDSIG